MKEQIKELRVEIDGLTQLVKGLKPIEVNLNDYIMSFSDLIEYPNLKQNLTLSSKELDKATDSLYLAKAWLGKVLQELGEATPYANDGNRKTVEDIEPTADVFPKEKLHLQLNKVLGEVSDIADKEDLYNKPLLAEVLSFGTDWDTKLHTEKIDWVRQEVEKIIAKTKPLVNTPFGNTVDYQTIVLQHLTEARFWLGFELARVRDESTSR